jgi:CHAT domain-containing protein
MSLKARLAVLSSCSSGFGTLRGGEGFQSLARSFAYAGCPSILMTMWEVTDRSTVAIMDRFYFYMSEGYSISESLWRSKLDFLEFADQLRSNPFFWSGYMLIGNTESLYPRYQLLNWKNIAIASGGLILITLGIIYLRYRRLKRAA